MHHFEYRDGRLYAEDVPVADLAAEYGTPLYVYSASTIRRHFKAFDSAFRGLDHLTCFSVKANSNLSVLRLMAELGGGVDIVSGGELYRALKAGVPSEKIVYSGVGKKDHEIREALEADILMFNVESMQELERINEIAQDMGRVARISFRINPDVDPKTHPYISTGMKKNKFGLDIDHSRQAYKLAQQLPGIEPVGMDCHIGSQLTSIDPFLETLEKLLAFYRELDEQGIKIRYLDLGGGLGITYDQEEPPHPEEFGNALTNALQGLPLTLILEPGRVIAGNTGILVTEVQYLKSTPSKNFVIVDAAMNDLVRPALYQSFHAIGEVEQHSRPAKSYDVVGPICETSDFLARDRELPEPRQGELLAVYSAGAYGFTMASNYNSRPRPAELIVDGTEVQLARRRETYDDLVALEP
ncbi:diaminopimelate decarboxylase [Paucidesulfovibrio gracilis DSM 16080]|uniref:Diaminopimelate decarboxylase n=1 Tax=Paucidesulfovibrio gracilis DSM 16080 TaxID=1121449 RepID=A0A1T4WQ42_9BACT|nr:diaminopimelate decarboxylase [Paucidesulfovibrio gracilis]SKA78731.1 diaminopimelate decarboxylase [Paucidesulfovibrio gracilis DSM 16080]